MNGDAHEQIPALVRDVHRAFLKLLSEQLEGSEINQTQWLMLNVASAGKIRCVGDINREVGLESGAATRALDKLEQKGLLRRHRSAADRRIVDVEITAAGREMVQNGRPRLEAFWRTRLDILDQGQWLQLTLLLRRLRDGLTR